MTDIQKEIFESIISIMKANLGKINLYSPDQSDLNLSTIIDDSKFPDLIDATIRIMKDQGYIKLYTTNSPWDYMLTKLGWAFTSFEDEARKQEEKDKTEKMAIQKVQLEIQELVDKLVDYPKVKQQAKDAVFWSRIAAIGTIAAAIIMLLQWKCNNSS